MSELVNDVKFALSETVRFWTALADTGWRKHDLVLASAYFKNFAEYHEQCALCEFTKSDTRACSARCARCPVDWYIPELDNNQEPDDLPKGTCQHFASPFYWWEKATTKEEKKRWAGEVVKLVQKTLDQLEETKMDEVGFLAENMREALTKAYSMDRDKFQKVMHNGEDSDYSRAKWHNMQDDFLNWYRHLDNANTRRFCYWVLYSEDEYGTKCMS